MQHGGPPAALLAHVLAPGGDLRLGRISVDFLGPIPRREFRIEVSPLKPGRLTYLAEARMVVDGRVAVTARGWHLATGPKPPVTTAETPPPPLPGPQEQDLNGWGYGEAIEWRFLRGAFFRPDGAAEVWTRVRHPLDRRRGAHRPGPGADRGRLGERAVRRPADGRVAVHPADDDHHLLRPAEGEWVHMSCRTELTADGVGLAHGDLHDAGGHLGEVSQPLLVRRRQ